MHKPKRQQNELQLLWQNTKQNQVTKDKMQPSDKKDKFQIL